MPRGRPPLSIGQHGKIKRTQLGTNVWVARCRYRALDGVVHPAQKQTPTGVVDRHVAAAETALNAHLAELLGGGAGGDDTEITRNTLVSVLLERHLDALREAGRAPRTIYTYTLRIRYWNAVASGITVGDCTPGRLNRHLEQVRKGHGDEDAKQLRTNIAAALDMAINAGVLDRNPARETKSTPRPKSKSNGGAQPLDPKVLPAVLKALLASDKCRDKDLTDPILMHLGTGLRVSEVLALRWSEFDPQKKIIAVSGRIVREIGVGLRRTPTIDSSKGTAPELALPKFVVDMLLERVKQERPNKFDLIFPSNTGTMRDPNNFASQWRGVRDSLEHLSGTTGHSFRKTLSNLATDTTADPRVAADVLGHSDMATTMKHYLQRGKVHPEVAAAVDKAVRGTQRKPRPSRKTA